MTSQARGLQNFISDLRNAKGKVSKEIGRRWIASSGRPRWLADDDAAKFRIRYYGKRVMCYEWKIPK
jgi:hypothetical protein